MYIYALNVLQFGKQVMYKFNLFHFLKSGAKYIKNKNNYKNNYKYKLNLLFFINFNTDEGISFYLKELNLVQSLLKVEKVDFIFK
jgi:hypothetical protein